MGDGSSVEDDGRSIVLYCGVRWKVVSRLEALKLDLKAFTPSPPSTTPSSSHLTALELQSFHSASYTLSHHPS